MPTPKNIHKQFSDALNHAFERADLERIVEFDLGVRYENVVRQGGTFSNECDDIIRWAEKHDQLDELRLAAYAANPDNQTLLAFVKQVDMGFVEAHIQAANLTKGQGETEAAAFIAALPPATGLQASVVAASLGEQTISLDLAIKRQLEARRRICVIEVPGQSIGTGFLIGTRLVLTNRHVLDAALRLNPADIRAVFDYSGDQSYESLPRKKFLLNTPIMMDDVNGLDYAVLTLDSDVEAERGFFTSCPHRLGDKSSVTIMGHPTQGTNALSLQYSWGMIRDINDQTKRISYTAQTGHGSSGSPIFNANFELVGLHHHGQTGVNNHGIPIWAIVDSLVRKGVDDIPFLKEGMPSNDIVGRVESVDLPHILPRHEDMTPPLPRWPHIVADKSWVYKLISTVFLSMLCVFLLVKWFFPRHNPSTDISMERFMRDVCKNETVDEGLAKDHILNKTVYWSGIIKKVEGDDYALIKLPEGEGSEIKCNFSVRCYPGSSRDAEALKFDGDLVNVSGIVDYCSFAAPSFVVSISNARVSKKPQ